MLKKVLFWICLRGSLSGSETACEQTWKLSLSHPHPSYSTFISALGKVCEWVVALSSSSVCSGVSRRHEVIEFPHLETSISAPVGNLPGMKWTADVYVYVNGASRKGEKALNDAVREGCNYTGKKHSPSKTVHKRKKSNELYVQLRKKVSKCVYMDPSNYMDFFHLYLNKSANIVSLRNH